MEDSAGLTSAVAHQSVTVNNVAPTVTFSAANDTTVNESGVTEHTYSYTISDPGLDTITAVSTSCDPPRGVKVAASDTNTNTTGSFKCTFPDGPATADLTANATDEHRAMALEAGADWHIAKPITPESLVAGIAMALAVGRSVDEAAPADVSAA